ncbi:pentapeptide repeat-containing protein [Thalassovita sp.]|uniref:pentapeptide repeat-containing protein n=1 Tax=Thalassovita sp. TaxID=1979401 RepID=UPI0028813510|nr:pentapeptide repeat-containing protein [Thalassovita sp.]MDF1801517.1 pentapeptide repeat-containing protein [Thalassovita sp.]
MTDQDITLTLPLTSQEFWVLVIAASVIGLSILTFRLGHTRQQANTPSEKWLTSALTVFTGILAPLWAALIVLVIYGLWRLAWSFPSLSDGTDLRWHVLSLVGLLTALGGLLGTPLALIRITLTERQTNATEQGLITDRITKAVEGLGIEKTTTRIGRVLRVKRAQKQHIFVPDGEALQINAPLGYQTLETRHDMWFDETEGDYLEGKTHVIKLLSAEETIIEWQDQGPQDLRGAESIEVGNWEPFNETVPNLEVRIGALFSLERISQDSARDHIQIMEILCAYIRSNAPAKKAKACPQPPAFRARTASDDWGAQLKGSKEALWSWSKAEHPRLDIQIALKILGRRSQERRLLEARGHEQSPVLSFVFDEATKCSTSDEFHAWSMACDDYRGYRLDLRDTDLQRADFSELNLNGALLNGSKLNGAKMVGTKLNGTKLWACEFQGSWMSNASLIGADMRTTKFFASSLDGADLRATVFSFEKIQRPFLCHSNTQWAACLNTDWRKFEEPSKLTADQIDQMFADESSRLPAEIPRPNHWPKETLNPNEFGRKWRAWQAEHGFQPPKNP